MTPMQRTAREPRGHDLLVSLVRRDQLNAVVPLALERLERDPLASGGRFRGDLLRALLELPSEFWNRYGDLYPRYRAVLRAGAAARRRLPPGERMEFWSQLEDGSLEQERVSC